MHIDALGVAIGAILTQPGEDGMDYPIVYSSRKLNKAERKYRHYLLANPFIFYTDHKYLKYLVNKPLHHGRICHWLLLFQEFEFEVVVRPGKLNVGPDHLSHIDTREEPTGVNDDLPDAHLFRIEAVPEELEEIAQFLETG